MSLKIQTAQALVVAAIIALGASFASAIGEQATPGTSGTPTTQPDQPTTPIPEIPAPNADFIKLDRDKNGTLSKSEASRNKDLAKRWDVLDANKDSKLDPGEFALFEPSPPANNTQKSSDSKQPDSQKPVDSLKTAAPPVM